VTYHADINGQRTPEAEEGKKGEKGRRRQEEKEVAPADPMHLEAQRV
jgi:hypothetical protein